MNRISLRKVTNGYIAEHSDGEDLQTFALTGFECLCTHLRNILCERDQNTSKNYEERDASAENLALNQRVTNLVEKNALMSSRIEELQVLLKRAQDHLGGRSNPKPAKKKTTRKR